MRGVAATLQLALRVLRPCGILLQVGRGGEIPVPITQIVTREIHIKGAFGFDMEFALAVQLIARKRTDVRPLITATLPYEQALDAFLLANDRTQSSKVQLRFAAA